MPKIPSDLHVGSPERVVTRPRETLQNRPQTPTLYIGIDPGQAGGLVSLSSSGKLDAVPMPETDREIWEWFLYLGGKNTHAFIEKVHAMPGQGVTSMFTFGYGFGGLKMALIAAGVSFEEVQPRAWQIALGIPPRKKDESDNAWKTRLLKHAQQLYPDLPNWQVPRSVGKQRAIADALLIATYCQRKHEGRL